MVRIYEEQLTKTADCSWVLRVNSVTTPKLFPPPWVSHQKFIVEIQTVTKARTLTAAKS